MEYALRSKYDIDIYTLVYLPERTFPEFERLNVYEISSIDVLRGIAETFFIRGLAFTALSSSAKVDLAGYDAVLIDISGIGEFFSIRNSIPGRTFAYCHSPLRAAGTKEDLEWMNRHLSLVRRLIHAPARLVYRYLQGFAWPRFDHVVFNSEKSRSRALSLGLVGRENSSVVYPGVDIPGDDCSREDGGYFLYVSRFAPMKRQYELLRAWEISRLWEKGYSLVLAGHPSKESYFQKVVSYARNLPRVEVYPDVGWDELYGLYRSATATIFLGYHEDFGITPLEGMSFGKNLLTVDSAGFLEVVGDALGIYYVGESVDDDLFVRRLSRALVRLARAHESSPEYFYNVGSMNRRYVLSRVNSWDDFARKLDARLREVM